MHIPVLTKEVLECLAPKPNEFFIDGTIGQGGHAKAILEKTGPDGRVLGIDLDANQIENAKNALAEFSGRITLVHDSYANLADIVPACRQAGDRNDFQPVNGILLDLGYSSWHVDDSEKGFSFQKDQPLDMRYNLENALTAEKVVNEYSQDNLENIFKIYGEEPFARQIAKEIISHRGKEKIQSTFQLKEIIEKAIPKKLPAYRSGRHHSRIHPATRTFQALRIAVNEELTNLARALPEAIKVLAPGGRMAIISFHSLEDRIVKNFFKDQEKQGIITIVTKKPVTADEQEIIENPRARSAKLRAIIKK